MRELFDRLLAEGEAGIDRLVAERTQESVMLDFKEARTTSGALSDADRKTFGKALSAFANSAGGLLVFGVEARKGADDVDCAQAAKPISNIERFKSEATTAGGQLLQPRHEGIAVEAIPSQRQAGAGYLLVHVERSERRPHRSEAAGQKQYFKRAGDNSFEMEHYDIEDAFRRITAPELSVYFKFDKFVGDEPQRIMILHPFLFNEGKITADNIYCHVSQMLNCELVSSTYSKAVEGGVDIVEGMVSQSLNPGLSHRLSSILIRTSGSITDTRNFGFCCVFGARDSAPRGAEHSGPIAGVTNSRMALKPIRI